MTLKKNIAAGRTRTSIHRIFMRYRCKLVRVISRIVKPSDIDDILQETFIRTYVAAEKTEIRHPQSFMLKTARNLALNHVTSAHNSRTDIVDPHNQDIHGAYNFVEAQVQAEERFLVFCRAVRSLPDQCRRVFILKKVYGFSQREISEYLGISESTVEKHVAKGLAICREAVDAMNNRCSSSARFASSGTREAADG